MRVILISAIYHKSLRLSAEDLRKSKAITLVNADIMSINTLVNTCYDSCASVAEVALGLGMLAKFVGPATIFALIPTIRMYSTHLYPCLQLTIIQSYNSGCVVCRQTRRGHSSELEQAY